MCEQTFDMFDGWWTNWTHSTDTQIFPVLFCALIPEELDNFWRFQHADGPVGVTAPEVRVRQVEVSLQDVLELYSIEATKFNMGSQMTNVSGSKA